MPSESQAFFKSFKASQLRLKDIGYTNSVSAIVGNVTGLSVQQKQTITRCLVGLRHKFTRNSSELFRQNSLKLKPVKFSYRSVLDIEYNSMFAYLDISCINDSFSEVFDQPLRSQPSECFIACPICKTIKDVAHMYLYPNQKWKSIKCSPCGKYKTARQWLCSCSIPWHSCAAHASQGHACGLSKETATVSDQNTVVAINLHARFARSEQRPLPVIGRSLGYPGENKGNRDRKRPAPRQQAPSKRARLTPTSGIPRSFLPSRLAMRFQAAIKSEPVTHSSAFS